MTEADAQGHPAPTPSPANSATSRMIHEALGEVSGLFMSQSIPGTSIVMPTEDLNRIADDLLAALNPDWQPIETAPKDGSRMLLAKFGWALVAPITAFSAETGPKEHRLWWGVVGFWSDLWLNWNDGVEPSGLAGPTHWMPIPSLEE